MISRRKIFANAFRLFDLSLMGIAFMWASLAVLHQSRTVTVLEFFSMRVKIQNFAIFLTFVLVWHLIFRISGLYDSRRLSSGLRETIDIVKATSLGTLVILAGGIAFRIELTTPLFLVVFWLVTTGTAIPSRLLLRAMLAAVRKRGYNLRDMVIVGTNNRALEFARRLASRPELGYRITGFVDQNWEGSNAFRENGYALTTDLVGFPQFLRNNVVDEVVVALPFRSMHDQASKIAVACEQQGIRVRVLTTLFDLKLAHASVEVLEGDPLITHTIGLVEGWPGVVKRLLDLTVSAIVLTLLLPLLGAVALLIKITSPGPALFTQKRLGLNKRHFNIYKFRTMLPDAEQRLHEIEHLNEVSGPVFKIKKDPRITPLGRILRRTSIDELPQLFNVLLGDMSLVGPRPLPVRDYEGFSEDWQRRRFSVKPGITCLWQVGGRSAIPFEKWMELDLQYIDKWSLWLDLQILLRTIPVVLRGSGAA